MHRNETVIRRHLDALAAGNVEAALEDYADDGTIRYPGHNRLTGEHRGRAAVRDFLGLALQLTDGTFRPTVHDILANDEHAVLLVACEATRDGRRYEWIAADVYHVADDRITDHWVLEGAQHVVDEVFA